MGRDEITSTYGICFVDSVLRLPLPYNSDVGGASLTICAITSDPQVKIDGCCVVTRRPSDLYVGCAIKRE